MRIRGVLRAELKCTSNKSFSVTRNMLGKISAAAAARGEIPAMEIQFLNPDGSGGETFAIVPAEVLDLLVKMKRDAGE